MYYEPNLGMMMYCAVCGRAYWCEDGDSVCSSSECQRIAYAERCERCDEILENDEEEYCEVCYEELEEQGFFDDEEEEETEEQEYAEICS